MGAWTEIVDYTVPSNTTSVVLNDFGTITKDDFIKILFTHVNPQGSLSVIKYEVNNATTTSHYHRQVLSANGTSVAAGRANDNELFATTANKSSLNYTYLKLSENDRANLFTNTPVESDTGIHTRFFYSTTSGATFTSGITSLTFTSDVSNGIGTGSRIQIYRLDAVKEADITTTANATQVDISSLSIGKDSEYLLVSYLTGTAGDAFLRAYVNDNTTAGNYYAQRISAASSTAAASRDNDARIAVYNGSVAPNVLYTHIKLSEIGAYTAQSYNIIFSGNSGIQLWNQFVSSTAENITSITKINLSASVSNAIGSGSRFELYKLK
jgi:hypothetical protein